MSAPAPIAPGWYQVARQTQRWWDGSRWTEDVAHHGRRTTVAALRRVTVWMQWAWVGIGFTAWVVFLALAFSFGTSTAVALGLLPVFGTAAIVAGAITGSRLLAALPPTPQPHPQR